MLTTQTAETVSRLRCINCGDMPHSAGRDFRCTTCGDLLEFFFPDWISGAPADPSTLKSLWLNRRTSLAALDQSGVWRFRELLPHIPAEDAITLREGNTPLYEMPRCARSVGVEHLLAKHQGMNPTASFKDTGMTFAASSAHQGGFRWVPKDVWKACNKALDAHTDEFGVLPLDRQGIWWNQHVGITDAEDPLFMTKARLGPPTAGC